MAGHSKWAQTKRKKAVVDAKRGKQFAKLLRAIEVAARVGGGNLDANPTLSDAVQRAKDSDCPNDNIEKAMKRGIGDVEGVTYETLMYEGYGPGGVAVLVEVMTDNRNRAAAAVRKMFSQHGGSMAEPGAVAWIFQQKGVILLPTEAVGEEDLLALALEAGGEDLKADGDAWELTCEPGALGLLRQKIEGAGLPVSSARLTMQPSTSVELDASRAGSVLALLDALEDADDVQEIYANFDVPDEVLAELAG